MSCQRSETEANDFVDGLLDERAAGDYEGHLGSCEDCRASVEALRMLKGAVALLPREIAPSRDLLGGVRRTAVHSWRPRWSVWAAGAVAASLLLAIGAAGSWWVMRPSGSTEPAAMTAEDELRAAEQAYVEATERLLAHLEQGPTQLSPETETVLAENLGIINEAIDRVHSAMETDPENRAHGQALAALYRKKVQTLWRASRLSS